MLRKKCLWCTSISIHISLAASRRVNLIRRLRRWTLGWSVGHGLRFGSSWEIHERQGPTQRQVMVRSFSAISAPPLSRKTIHVANFSLWAEMFECTRSLGKQWPHHMWTLLQIKAGFVELLSCRCIVMTNRSVCFLFLHRRPRQAWFRVGFSFLGEHYVSRGLSGGRRWRSPEKTQSQVHKRKDDEVDEHQTPHGTQKNYFCGLQKKEDKIRSIIL